MSDTNDTTRVTIQEACKIANISRKTLYRWIEKGLLSKGKDGNRSYVSLAEVQALCNQSDKPDDTTSVTGDNRTTQSDTGKVTVDMVYLEGLLVKLGQMEAERRYLLEYKGNIEQKDKVIAEQQVELNRLKAELERSWVPWYRRLFKK
jgi:excisionase family DNA binding protein